MSAHAALVLGLVVVQYALSQLLASELVLDTAVKVVLGIGVGSIGLVLNQLRALGGSSTVGDDSPSIHPSRE